MRNFPVSLDWAQSVCDSEKAADGRGPRPGATVDPDDVAEHCRARLASFKKPELVRVVDELPKNPMGKVLRRELHTMLEGP